MSMSMADSKSARPHTGKWFEELTPGLVIPHAIRRTLTESDNVSFTTMTMNPAWLHLDFDYATNETEFGRPLVNSMLTVAVVIGISVHETTLGTTVANLGFREVTFPAPVFHGDTIYAETEVLSKRESKSKPDRGIIRLKQTGRNQKGEVIVELERTVLFLKRPTEEE